MQKITDFTSGIYILEIFAPTNFNLNILKYKDIELKEGFYYYVGSAQKGMHHRIKRHLAAEKKIHWHIDHLTCIKTTKIKTVYIMQNAPKNIECQSVAKLLNTTDLIHPLKGFGNGDCYTCISHLLYSAGKISQSHLLSLYQDIVRFIPSSKEIF